MAANDEPTAGTPARSSRLARAAAVVAVAATLYFLAAALAAHLVDTPYDWVRDYISDYAVGPRGWIYGSAYWASFVGCVALAIALWRGVPAVALSRGGVVLLIVVGLASLVDFYFPTDILPPGAPPTTGAGKIHFLAAAAGWVAFVVAAPMISLRLGRDPQWSPWRRPLMFLARLSTPLLAALVVVVATKAPIGGLAEKAFILDRDLWALLAALLAFRLSREPHGDPSAESS